MKVDRAITSDLTRAATDAARAEAEGYDGVFTAETSHDPFLPLVPAIGTTERLEIGTAIAVAFARSPMTLAQTAWDLQSASGGRLLLGLGSQIRPHIERRFSMPWSRPAARMREFILAMRAIWRCFGDGERLAFEGEFYQHNLMTPFFNPGPTASAQPKVLLAAVGEKMTEVAGEVADGMLVHGFTTEAYLREVTLPALQRGAAAAGRPAEELILSLPAFVVTGTDEQSMAEAADAVRSQIAFYGSTPAYRGVLERHGWADLQPQLRELTKENRWAEMGSLIDDEILGTFAVVAEPDKVAPALLARFGDVIHRISLYAPYRTGEGVDETIRTGLQEAQR